MMGNEAVLELVKCSCLVSQCSRRVEGVARVTTYHAHNFAGVRALRRRARILKSQTVTVKGINI